MTSKRRVREMESLAYFLARSSRVVGLEIALQAEGEVIVFEDAVPPVYD